MASTDTKNAMRFQSILQKNSSLKRLMLSELNGSYHEMSE